MTNEKGAANKIAVLAAKALKLQEMKEFQSKYAEVIKAYQESPLALLSTININELNEFQEWKQHLLDNKDKTIPMIISKMLKGDIFAFSIYKELTPHIIDYDMVHHNKDMNQELQYYGGAEDGLAIINARHWLGTKDAVEVFAQFTDGKNIECEVNEMLNINNEFIDCIHNF
ncbi:hypothetical protein [Rickettsiales endosymbiont of Trichoplax sp. H2]|uniref:hypothetical protein n=1 Tax=Rickettsiales endosymbiont of Trichoplax sp. H2 TaxID=2021221 RepID=UPI0012B3C6ED|nr:hypothetical protein [Rickettsiales endosymbiont of Trichoplax sp. H2]MSO14386.1 hypothetical protein [Rickettsiales endosymbiont of Trichoplax sp. H2]